MKKTFSILAGGLALAFAFQSCQQNVDMTAINAKIDSIANVKIQDYKTQLMNECSAKVKAAAALKAEELIAAASKGGKKAPQKPSTPPPPPPKEEKKEGGKLIDKSNDGKMIDKMNDQNKGGGKLIDKMGGKQNPPKQ